MKGASDWWVEGPQIPQADWKFTAIENGERSVATILRTAMHKLYVNSWDSLAALAWILTVLAKVQAQYGWIIWLVAGAKPLCRHVLIVVGGNTIAAITKMLLFSVRLRE